jgi:hypothetical protein
MRSHSGLIMLGALCVSSPALAQNPERHLIAQRITAPIIVDGILDEPDWARASGARDFTQGQPDEGRPATEESEVRVLYDDRTIYIGAFLRHRHAGDIVVNELMKDFDGSNTDYFAVIFDTFHDRRSGYQFGVNPAGARWDSQKFNEGRQRNLSWDGAWTVRTRRTADGWYAEFAIPFRTMQLPRGEEQTWGINFVRHLQRRLEDSYWAPVPRQYFVDRMSLAGTLTGLHGIAPATNLRLKPFVATRSAERDAGFDLKYALTSSITADVTAHTDFSEVEADDQQLTSSRFSLFVPEKREFFLENAGIYQFGPGSERTSLISPAAGTSAAGRDNAVQNDMLLLHTRRIGLSATGEAIPIIGGARVSGHQGRHSIGLLSIWQQADDGTPATNFTVARLRTRVGTASDVGLMVLDREGGAGTNRVAGMDANVRMTSALTMFGYVAGSEGGPAAGGTGSRLAMRGGLRYRDGDWEVEGSGGTIGGRFEDALGFVPQSGIARQQALLGRHLRFDALARWVREIYPAVGFTESRDETGAFDSRYWEARVPVTFRSGATLEVGVNPNDELVTSAFTVNAANALVVAPGHYRFTDRFIAYTSAKARRLAWSARAAAGDYYDGSRAVVSASIYGRVNAHLAGSMDLIRDETRLPGGTATTTLLTARAKVGFTTNAFLFTTVQYNSNGRLVSSNVRFNFIHHPLSDLFIVLNTRDEREPAARRERTIAVKVTHLFSI